MRPLDDGAADPADRVVLLDDDGRPTGSAPRAKVHTTDTPLHLAFSLYVLDTEGRLLLTRRALGKTAWPGVWTNSCCGHPRPGESIEAAVRRRTAEELGLEIIDVTTVLPDFRYRAVDASGVVENELCPVHVTIVEPGMLPRPDPAEVAEHVWLGWPAARRIAREAPALLSPWMVLQVEQLAAVLGEDPLSALTRSSIPGGAR